MLKIKNFSASYGSKKVLRNLNLEIKKSEIIAIVGESGTGKTTLAMSIMGLLTEQFDNTKQSGSILFNGIDICSSTHGELRQIRWKKISMVFQNIDNILNPTISVDKQLNEILNGKKNNSKINEMLEMVGFPPARAGSYPHQLSMGEKQKILVAMAYISEPELVLLDEPTSSLDYDTKINLIRVIKKLSPGRTAVLLTHDLDTVKKLSEKVIVLYGGRILESGPTKKIFSNPRHPYTRGLVRSYPSMDRTKDLQGIRGKSEFIDKGCPFWPRCTQAINLCRIYMPPLKKYGDTMLACHRGGIIPLLNVENISKSYNNLEVLKSIYLSIYEGETVALLGKSGSGKTTLAKIIMGLVKPDGGHIYLENNKIEKWDFGFYKKVQMIFQEVESAVSHRLNVINAVMEPILIHRNADRRLIEEKAKKVLSEVELPTDDNFLKLYPHHLSGGELQRVVIARALILSPGLLIADEPTSSLDASIQAKIIKMLNRIQEERGLGMLFITHDLGVARKVSDRIIKLEDGIITEARLK
jgi:peptide/nickel transport system ATP-binding protein